MKADQVKVYQIYERLNHESTGRGMGMYLVKRIVDLNNGSIEMESEKNGGTTFYIRLPVPG
jgi:signal transduction histidine kinase